MRRERQKSHQEIIKRCLKQHMGWLQEQILLYLSGNSLEEATRQLERCRNLLADPSKLSDAESAFLVGEYYNFI